jgi:hypothetical protein
MPSHGRLFVSIFWVIIVAVECKVFEEGFPKGLSELESNFKEANKNFTFYIFSTANIGKPPAPKRTVLIYFQRPKRKYSSLDLIPLSVS